MQPTFLFLGKYQYWKENEAYFFTHQHQTYLPGDRMPNGFWEADKKDEYILDEHNLQIVGFKSTFTFYRVIERKEEETDWVMTEFKVHSTLIPYDAADENLMLCKIEYNPQTEE